MSHRLTMSQQIPKYRVGDKDAADDFVCSDRNVLPSSDTAWVIQATVTAADKSNGARELPHDFNDN